MISQKTENLSVLDYSPGLSVRIFKKSDTEYECTITYDNEQSGIHNIDITIDDIAELNSKLQRRIQDITEIVSEDSIDDTELYRHRLRELAVAGQQAFNIVFPRKEIVESINSFIKTGSIIQVVSDNFFLPWDLLYNGPLESVDENSFLGMKYIISRQITRFGGLPIPTTINKNNPHIGMIIDDSLDYVDKYEVPIFKNLKSRGDIELSIMRPLDPINEPEDIRDFKRFLENDIDIFHAACHAENSELKSEIEPYLRVANSFPIYMNRFDAYDIKLKHHPFVILNACRTGTANPRRTSNWARRFWKSGARGILATEFRVPDWFAAKFIERLYKYFLSGSKIGESLLKTRKDLWKEQKHILGLAYALYSPPSVKIAIGAANERTE